jgi:hypothetical protein
LAGGYPRFVVVGYENRLLVLEIGKDGQGLIGI